ncbi:MAG: permease [Candidatus Tectomicrobia bacterium]|uniref:Permease n=1 Tax=Tectimicrobiota bacterium TaxID=2528274 RepID=A0A932GSB1_UNCTE|nr:permease [Candidatus Tectomicrobia bacterium]
MRPWENREGPESEEALTVLLLWEILRAGLLAVWDYVALHVLTCLIPAFLLAGAMVAFINKEAIMARLGAAASKPRSFATAAGASFFVAACSCTVIPVSSGIYYSGAGIGAAFILLWVAPASNLLSLIYTGNILGAEMAWVRVITALTMAAVVGTIMTVVFRWEEARRLADQESSGAARGNRKPPAVPARGLCSACSSVPAPGEHGSRGPVPSSGASKISWPSLSLSLQGAGRQPSCPARAPWERPRPSLLWQSSEQVSWLS